jgi:hypothetical protein
LLRKVGLCFFCQFSLPKTYLVLRNVGLYFSCQFVFLCVYVTFLQVVMERTSWMYNLSRLDLSYISEVHMFIDVATNHAWRTKTKHIYCSCMNYKNVVLFDDKEQIISHLLCREFMKDYIIWTKHGEVIFSPYTTGNPENIDDRF